MCFQKKRRFIAISAEQLPHNEKYWSEYLINGGSGGLYLPESFTGGDFALGQFLHTTRSTKQVSSADNYRQFERGDLLLVP